MHQLHRVSGIKGSGFSHPPPLLALKKHNAHSASRGEGNRAAKADVSAGPGLAGMPGLSVPSLLPPRPPWMAGSTFRHEDVCNLISAALLQIVLHFFSFSSQSGIQNTCSLKNIL